VVGDARNLVLGAHRVRERVKEIIQCLVALRIGANRKDFDETIGIHPSFAEDFFTMR